MFYKTRFCYDPASNGKDRSGKNQIRDWIEMKNGMYLVGAAFVLSARKGSGGVDGVGQGICVPAAGLSATPAQAEPTPVAPSPPATEPTAVANSLTC